MTTRDSRLPDIIKIDDITSGKIEPQLIYEELDRLKVEIDTIRNDMSMLVQSLANIPDNQSQKDYYKHITVRLKALQQSIHDYCGQYQKLLPVINLAQIKLGQEVETIPTPPKNRALKPASNGNNSIGMNGKFMAEPNKGSQTQPIVL